MTKQLRTELAHSIADLDRDLQALNDRVDGLAARLEWIQIELRQAIGIGQQGPPMTTERAWATPVPRRRLLNGSWPLLDGNIYPRFDTTRRQGPLGGYESYVRRSPPATD